MVVVGVFVLAKYLLPPQLQMLCTSAFIGVGRGIVRVVVVEIKNSVEKLESIILPIKLFPTLSPYFE